jgi:hypothetical protein
MQTVQLANRVSGLRTGVTARRNVLVRFQDDKKQFDPVKGRLSPEELRQVETRDVGQLSPEMAEKRADLGQQFKQLDPKSAASDGWTELQAFDGPAPETINSRLAMLGVVIGLWEEFATGHGLKQQWGEHTERILLLFALFTIASYIPILRGYTRKEPFANGPWTPRAENWNGRLAQMGFLGMVLTEAWTHMNTLQALGLQSINH